ncbi:hypothetical protein LSH36_63g11004 [Paralvinella palmiformis]|uniref:Uncharacterized protein n=1 Tax=Paralvinella palmiformis TaxID=53620 RepID=A0AAD9K3Y1_9ANNE|nr:hypothetical protein LSH36_63g11004 [Paralvinella palmiformis]
MMPGSSADGEVLVHDGPWTWKFCRRVCRRYLECLAFKMSWNTNTPELGMCTIFKGFFKRSKLMATTLSTMYSKYERKD